MNASMKIDPEFEGLLPPLTEDEFAGLERNVLANGIRDRLVVWKGHGVLVDGHNRYKLALKHKLKYELDEREFETRDDVCVFILDNQFDRRNLADYTRVELALKKQDYLRRKAKENQLGGLKQGSVLPTLGKREETVHVDAEIAKSAGVGRETVRKVRAITTKAPEELKQKLRKGEVSIHKAHLQVTGTTAPPKLERLKTPSGRSSSALDSDVTALLHEVANRTCVLAHAIARVRAKRVEIELAEEALRHAQSLESALRKKLLEAQAITRPPSSHPAVASATRKRSRGGGAGRLRLVQPVPPQTPPSAPE